MLPWTSLKQLFWKVVGHTWRVWLSTASFWYGCMKHPSFRFWPWIVGVIKWVYIKHVTELSNVRSIWVSKKIEYPVADAAEVVLSFDYLYICEAVFSKLTTLKNKMYFFWMWNRHSLEQTPGLICWLLCCRLIHFIYIWRVFLSMCIDI
jgi:hypothetical protein